MIVMKTELRMPSEDDAGLMACRQRRRLLQTVKLCGSQRKTPFGQELKVVVTPVSPLSHKPQPMLQHMAERWRILNSGQGSYHARLIT